MSKARSRARSLAVQAIYRWQMSGENIAEIIQDFAVEHTGKGYDKAYFHNLVEGVPTFIDELDQALQPYLDRPVEKVDWVERAILRLAAYELLKRPEVPYRVVINEAIELAKTFGAEQGHRYVNGVLDQLAKKVRALEMRM